MNPSKVLPNSQITSLITLFFVSTVTQYVIFIAILPFFLFGLTSALVYENFNLLRLDPGTSFIIIVDTFVFALLTYFFNRYFLRKRAHTHTLSLFLAVLAVSILVHYSALLHGAFFYYLVLLLTLSSLQTTTVLHAMKQLASKHNSAVIPSMILAMIGGVILVLQFVINSYVWVGESIMKLTTNQFNIFWLDYGGFAAITFSLLTCVLYFTFFSAINAFQKR